MPVLVFDLETLESAVSCVIRPLQRDIDQERNFLRIPHFDQRIGIMPQQFMRIINYKKPAMIVDQSRSRET